MESFGDVYKNKKKWKYLYIAIDIEGNTLDFMLGIKRDTKAAKRFFKKILKVRYNQQNEVIIFNKSAS